MKAACQLSQLLERERQLIRCPREQFARGPGIVVEPFALRDPVEDLGSRKTVANAVFTRANLELLAGAPDRAEKVARASLQAFEATGNRSQGSTRAAFVGLALVEQGRDDEALEYADIAAEWAVPDDIASQVSQLGVRARVLAGRSELAPAEAAARDAVAQSEGFG
jgi:hypothetical protein